MNARKSKLVYLGISLLAGTVLTFALFFLGIAGIEVAWTLQMPGMWIADSLGFSVHGGLLLVAVPLNALLYGAFCYFVIFLLKRKRRNGKAEG